MRVVLVAVGRLRQGLELELFDRYRGRLAWPLDMIEVEERGGGDARHIKKREGERLLAALPEGATVVALDERGRTLDSAAFATKLGGWRDQGVRDLAFVIGGADGLDEPVRRRADLLLSLGTMTWPHLLCRALIAEQVYRAQAILAGHPYHRA